jgi:hypothetical protein
MGIVSPSEAMAKESQKAEESGARELRTTQSNSMPRVDRLLLKMPVRLGPMEKVSPKAQVN